MKKTFLLFFALVMAATAKAQFSEGCEPRFSAFFLYGMKNAFGSEIGRIAVETKWSYLGGFNLRAQQSTFGKDSGKTVVESTVYLKTMYRINRFVHPVAAIGIAIGDKESVFAEAGVRIIVPLLQGSGAIFIEPTISTQRVNLKIGIGLPTGRTK